MAKDDVVMPFEVKPLATRGRVLRLGAVIDDILSKHKYPQEVSNLLGQTVAIVALVGSALKFDGKLILQTRSDGPVSMLVADYTTPGKIRGYAHFDNDAKLDGLTSGELTGNGHFALTIDQGEDMDNYQGIVELKGQSIAEAALSYFEKSEQIPSRLKVACGRVTNEDGESWRAGAIMVQHMPGDDSGEMVDNDGWQRVCALLETVEDHELLDPTLDPERLAYRLFHEDGVTAYEAIDMEHKCTCSQARVGDMLKSFSKTELDDMVVDGNIEVTCQFCSNKHKFERNRIG